jgi:hypothetical protein
MNWSTWGNKLMQYFINTSIASTVNSLFICAQLAYLSPNSKWKECVRILWSSQLLLAIYLIVIQQPVSEKKNFEMALNFTNRSCHEIFDKYRLFGYLLCRINKKICEDKFSRAEGVFFSSIENNSLRAKFKW